MSVGNNCEDRDLFQMCANISEYEREVKHTEHEGENTRRETDTALNGLHEGDKDSPTFDHLSLLSDDERVQTDEVFSAPRSKSLVVLSSRNENHSYEDSSISCDNLYNSTSSSSGLFGDEMDPPHDYGKSALSPVGEWDFGHTSGASSARSFGVGNEMCTSRILYDYDSTLSPGGDSGRVDPDKKDKTSTNMLNNLCLPHENNRVDFSIPPRTPNTYGQSDVNSEIAIDVNDIQQVIRSPKLTAHEDLVLNRPIVDMTPYTYETFNSGGLDSLLQFSVDHNVTGGLNMDGLRQDDTIFMTKDKEFNADTNVTDGSYMFAEGWYDNIKNNVQTSVCDPTGDKHQFDEFITLEGKENKNKIEENVSVLINTEVKDPPQTKKDQSILKSPKESNTSKQVRSKKNKSKINSMEVNAEGHRAVRNKVGDIPVKNINVLSKDGRQHFSHYTVLPPIGSKLNHDQPNPDLSPNDLENKHKSWK